MAHRMQMKRSKQAIIAGKLLRIRAEMRTLDNQLKTAKAHSDAQEQQSSAENVASSNLAELETLKAKLVGFQETSAFKEMLATRGDIA